MAKKLLDFQDVLKEELKDIRGKRSVQRSRRLASGFSLVAFAGYTNAGKTTLFNLMARKAKKATMPKIEWILEIFEACDRAGIPVFLKDNLVDLLAMDKMIDGYLNPQFFNVDTKLRQEFPS